jgi:hypothetical protein
VAYTHQIQLAAWYEREADKLKRKIARRGHAREQALVAPRRTATSGSAPTQCLPAIVPGTPQVERMAAEMRAGHGNDEDERRFVPLLDAYRAGGQFETQT